MKRRALLTLIPFLLLAFFVLGGVFSAGFTRPVLAGLNAQAGDQTGYLPVILRNYTQGGGKPTVTPRPTAIATATNTAVSPTATNTDVPPTATNTTAPTSTSTPTNTPTATYTATPTNTPLPTNSPTPTITLTPAPTATATTTPSGPPAITPLEPWPVNPISGQSTTLRWSISGAVDTLVLKANDGSADIPLATDATSYKTKPTQINTVYSLTATNEDGSVTVDFTEVVLVSKDDVPPLLAYEWNGLVPLGQSGFPKNQPPLANGNWRTPYNYAEGTLYYRVNIVEDQLNAPQDMGLQFCMWQEKDGDNFALENCVPDNKMLIVTGTQNATANNSHLVQSLYKKNGLPLEWDRARYRYAVAIKNSDKCPVSNYDIKASTVPAACPSYEKFPLTEPGVLYMVDWAGEDEADWYTVLNMHFTVYIIAQGDTFPGWDNLP